MLQDTRFAPLPNDELSSMLICSGVPASCSELEKAKLTPAKFIFSEEHFLFEPTAGKPQFGGLS